MKLLRRLQSMLGFGDPAPADPSLYRAVIARATGECCAAARATLDQPLLLSDHPTVPLRGCTMPENCLCRLRPREDRRVGERRFEGDAIAEFATDSHRASNDRRKTPVD